MAERPVAATLLALDVGNTSVAAALFDAVALAAAPAAAPLATLHRVRAAHGADNGTSDGAIDGDAELRHVSAEVARLAPTAVVIGAVHRFGAALAERLRSEAPHRSLAVFDRGADFPLARDLLDAASVGVDRLAAARAAFALAGGAALVVNAGTALTVDWIDGAGRFRGGAIVPGRALQARALRLFTDRLPEIAPWSGATPLLLPGRDSEQAIRHGLDVGVPGMVEALLAALAKAAGGAPARFVSGGDAEWLAARLAGPLRREPFLVARGLALAALESRR